MSDYDSEEVNTLPIKEELPVSPVKPKQLPDPSPPKHKLPIEPKEDKKKEREKEKERKRKQKEKEKERKRKEKELKQKMKEAEEARKRKEKEAKEKLEKSGIQVQLPRFFHERATNRDEEKELYTDALNWFLGLKDYAGSYSAFITYLGPGRVQSRNISIATRSARPNRGNWRLYTAPVRFFRGQEAGQRIKDPKFIKDALASKNYNVRIVKDEKVKRKDIREKVIKKKEQRTLGLPQRLRFDQIKQGLPEVPLNPGEAQEFLAKLEAEGHKMSNETKEHLKNLIKRDKENQKEK